MATTQSYKRLANTPVNFEPLVFPGTTLDFKPNDYGLLERGIINLDKRRVTASEKQTAVDLALADIESKLNPTERKWFSSYKQDIKSQIQTDIDAGNYTTAIAKATKLAGHVASDSRLLGRIEQNAKYQTALEEVRKDKNLTKDQKAWWEFNHKYSYEDKYDAYGNPIAADIKNYSDRPIAPMDLTKLAATAIQLVAPEKTSSKGSVTNYGGLGQYADNGEQLMTNQYDFSSIKLDEEKLKETFNAIFANNPEAKQYLTQEREIAYWRYRELEDLIEATEDPLKKQLYKEEQKQYKDDIFGADGHLMTETEYITKKVSPILHNAAYEYKDTSSGKVYGLASGGSKTSGSQSIAGAGISGLPDGFTDAVSAGTVNIDESSRATNSVKTVGDAIEQAKAILEKAMQQQNDQQPESIFNPDGSLKFRFNQ